MNTYWISLPCDLLSSMESFQCSLLHHLHLSSDLGLSKYVNQHSHLNLSRYVRLSVLYDLDFNMAWAVEKLQFSLFLISCSQRILNASLLSWILLLKNACLHVSFTAYDNFYKLSKMHCLLVLTFHFPIFRTSECRNPTIKHIFTYTLISPFISTYVIDFFLVILFT